MAERHERCAALRAPRRPGYGREGCYKGGGSLLSRLVILLASKELGCSRQRGALVSRAAVQRGGGGGGGSHAALVWGWSGGEGVVEKTRGRSAGGGGRRGVWWGVAGCW